MLSVGRNTVSSNLRTPLLASYLLFASSELFISKESISNINSIFGMETPTLLPKEQLRQAFSYNIHFMHSPITLDCRKVDGTEENLDLCLSYLIILPSVRV